jgi:hypothetical protein
VTAGEDSQNDIDEALAAWRQGDVSLDADLLFAHLADLARPITEEARGTAAAQGAATGSPNPDVVRSETPGLVMLTQSCDIVRPCRERPYVEMAPLALVTPTVLKEIQRLMRPGLAFVPAMAGRRLVADLDRVMTVEKALVARWSRVTGCRSDDEARAFAEALARKRARFAFPDDFVAAAHRLRTRLKKRHDRSDAEGAHLRALREIRVRAGPGWDADPVHLTFWLIKDADPPGMAPAWDGLVDAWSGLVDRSGRYRVEAALVVRREDMTARDYVDSDRLDLDQLSAAR